MLQNKLSSDLHDEVGSILSGVAYQMEMLSYTVEAKHQAMVRNIADASRSAMMKMRDVVWAIDSSNNQVGNLVDRIREFNEEVLEPLSIELNINVSQDLSSREVPQSKRYEILLIIKEFMTNSIKHAQATQVDLHMSIQNNNFIMEIHDNGIGISSPLETTGKGISSMRNRTQAIQGSFHFIESPGTGIRISVPI